MIAQRRSVLRAHRITVSKPSKDILANSGRYRSFSTILGHSGSFWVILTFSGISGFFCVQILIQEERIRKPIIFFWLILL